MDMRVAAQTIIGAAQQTDLEVPATTALTSVRQANLKAELDDLHQQYSKQQVSWCHSAC
jgi:hypothetical protein